MAWWLRTFVFAEDPNFKKKIKFLKNQRKGWQDGIYVAPFSMFK